MQIESVRVNKKKDTRDVLVSLVRALDAEAEILGLNIGEGGEFDVAVGQVKASDFLVKDLRENIDLLLELAALGKLNVLPRESSVVTLVKHNLSENLVGEAARHDEGAVASGTAKIDKAALGKEDDVAAALHQEAVNLRLDVLD